MAPFLDISRQSAILIRVKPTPNPNSAAATAKEEGDNGVRKASPSPTRSAVPKQRKKPSGGVPRWLILDRIVHRSSRTRHTGVVADDATTSTLAHDCVGRPVRASLRIAAPPAISRLYLHLTGRPPVEGFPEPTAIAAHRSSILFYMATPFEDPLMWSRAAFFPDDYFVYSSTSPPTLTLLPPCFHGGDATNPELDHLFLPYRNQQQRIMLDQDVGILCHGDGDQFFTVAQLTFSENDEFELCVLHHASKEWSVKKVQKKPPGMKKICIYSWMTDAVVPVGRCSLCWVDYYQGMLLVHVLTDSSSSSSSCDPDHRQSLRYIPLPNKALKSRRPYRDAGSPDPLRCVGVTDNGIVKLVCILTKRPDDSSCPFTIKTWILADKHEGKWTMDVDTTMGGEEFFGLFGAGHGFLPRVHPSFPLLSLGDPDVVCFLLKDKDRGLFWMIEVDMRNKKLLSSALYINEEEEGYPPKRGLRNNFFGHCFIPSKFSSYLSDSAITSQDLSEKMQKTKEDSVMQKSGLDRQLD